MRFYVLEAAVLFAAVSAAAAPASSLTSSHSGNLHVVHERRDSEPHGWIKRAPVPSHAPLSMRVALTQNNLHRAEEYLMDVSDPTSENYGKHWTSQQVIDAFGPSNTTVDSVRDWLTNFGIDQARITHSDNKGWLAFDATAEEAGNLLRTQYHHYEHALSGLQVPSCDVYHVPEHIQPHIDYVTPGLKLLTPSKGSSLDTNEDGKAKSIRTKRQINPTSYGTARKKKELAHCDTDMTPACIAALYGIPPAPKNAIAGNEMGIFQQLQTPGNETLDIFYTKFAPHIPNGTYPEYKAVFDGKELFEDGPEANLDFQMAYPIVYPQNIVQYNIGWEGNINHVLDAFDGSYCTYRAFNRTGETSVKEDPGWSELKPPFPPWFGNGTLQCGIYKPPHVLSFSYGSDESTLPASYQQRACNEYLKLGLQGVSMIFSSGDSGVAAARQSISNTTCVGPNDKIFNPGHPVTCPWLTSVGGTMLRPGASVLNPEPEIVAREGRNYSPGGGFSNIYPRPPYQRQALDTYFSEHNPPYPSYSGFWYNNLNHTFRVQDFHNTTGLYNRIGRGHPDVSAIGANVAIYDEGQYQLGGGTSASAPIFAAILNRINEERLRVGKSTVGFVNPVLYANPWVMNDITKGNNPGCGTEGFSAVKGWDPVTGLGSPNYPKMLKLFMDLP